MDNIGQRLEHVLKQIRQAESDHRRPANSVALLAVSKTWPAQFIVDAAAVGQRLFGENYVQEAIEKFDFIQTHHPELNLEWHFIGHLQSNKSRDIAQRFDWVHSVDRLKLAKRLNDQRPNALPPLNICLQVNIGAEPSKAGLATADLVTVAKEVASLKQLRLRGLMAIPRATADEQEQRQQFRQLRYLLNDLQRQLPELDTLSMGMSNDLEAAIKEGATWVRIGTAIFGPRPAKPGSVTKSSSPA